MNKNKKALGIMLGTLVFLLVLAVVLLSVIIVSLAKDDDPVITTGSRQTQSQPVLTTSSPTTSRAEEPTTVLPGTSEQPEVTTDPVISSEEPTADPAATSEEQPQTTAPEVTTKPPVQGPNIPVGDVATVQNPDGSITRSGAFLDNGSTKLHILVEWEAKYASVDATAVNLTVRVYLECYSIGISARDNGILTINGESTTYSTPRIFYSTNELHHTLMTDRTVTISKSSPAFTTEVDLGAAWNYNASYSGVSIDWLTVSGTIEV